MISHDEYLRYKALLEAFDAEDPATYVTASPEIQQLIDQKAARFDAEYRARVEAVTPADCDRWESPPGYYIHVSPNTPLQQAVVDLINIQDALMDMSRKMGWEPIILE